MTTKLNYDDIVSCCNSCSEPEPEITTAVANTVQPVSNGFNLYANVTSQATTTSAMNTPDNVFTSTAAPVTGTTTAAPVTGTTTSAPLTVTTTSAPLTVTTTAAPLTGTTTAAPVTGTT